MHKCVRVLINRIKDRKKQIYGMSTDVVKMSAAASTTMSTHTSAAAQTTNANDNKTSATTDDQNSSVVFETDEVSSFCSLSSIKNERSEECQQRQRQHCNVPLENSIHNRQPLDDEDDTKNCPTTFSELNEDNFVDKNQRNKHASIAEDVDLSSSAQISPGLSLLQQTAAAASSPPPHSYRHSRAYRHFKNPPQPHMCIRTTTETGEELFINVLSWTRIVIPQEPSDPIPLYGGMRVPPGSPRSPPIVFAVMANPEVLKDSGRHSKDPEERRAMVELMCDFVEAMNPGVKLVRNAIILKDRDISGELKDVWNAVQAQRDREREEQIILQRQQHQQHFHHNLTSSATTNNGTFNGNSLATATNSLSTTPPTTHQMFPKTLHSANANSNDTTALPNVVDGGTPPRSRKIIMQQMLNDYDNTSNIDEKLEKLKEGGMCHVTKSVNSEVSLSLLAERLDNKLLLTTAGEEQQKNELQLKQLQQQQQQNQKNLFNDDALSNGCNRNGSLLEMSGSSNSDGKIDINQLNVLNCKKERSLKNGYVTSCNNIEIINANEANTPNTHTPPVSDPNPPAQIVNPSPSPPVQQTPTKKEKLGGFLPNGCIFPRFTKNNKYKDKDKDKEKETKPKDKEKNVLLSALKKSKDKKTANAAANNDENNTSSNTNTAVANNCFNQTQQTSFNKQQKNCLPQLECGVQKLDLNNHHHHNQHHHPPHNSENATTTTTTSKNNAANKNSSSSKSSSVGVH